MKNSPEYIICHHSLTEDGDTVSASAIRKYHIDVLKMEDIGYHLIVELVNGRYEVFFGRMPNYHGAHCREERMNFRSIGICFVGNFDISKPPKQMWNLGLRVVRYFMDVYGIPRANVKGHRELAAYKSCPGLWWSMSDFRSDL